MSERFPRTSPELVEVLEQLLEFNPFFRPTASEILKHKLFDNIRQPGLELPAPKKISIDLEEEGLEAQFS